MGNESAKLLEGQAFFLKLSQTSLSRRWTGNSMKRQLFEMENNNQNDTIISMNGAFLWKEMSRQNYVWFWKHCNMSIVITGWRAVYSLNNCSGKAYIVTTGVLTWIRFAKVWKKCAESCLLLISKTASRERATSWMCNNFKNELGSVW